MTEIEILRKKLEREKLARKEAESILEIKAQELYEANQNLQAFNASLEQEIEKRTAQLLSKERQFKALVDHANDIIITLDEEGFFLMVNPVALRTFGYQREDIIGTRYIHYIQEDHQTEVFAHYLMLKEGKIQESYLEFPVVTSAGKTIWLGQKVTRLTEGGQIVYSAVARDITDKVTHLQELTKVNSRFTALLENLPDGILVEDKNRKVILANKAFTRMFELPLPPEALAGMDYRKLALEAASFFEDEAGFSARIDDIVEKWKIVTNEDVKVKDGRIFSRNFIPIVANGKNQGALWYYADISERRNRELIIQRSEEKYRGIIETMDLGIMEVNMNDEILRVYDSFNTMTGYEKGELIGKKTKEVLLVEKYREVLEEQLANRKKGISSAYEMKIRRKDQSEIWVLVSGAPFYDEFGKVIGSIGLHFDITSRKNLEQELKIAREKAVKAQQAEKQFLANMSHEIRTPLNAVIGMSHLLKDTKLHAEQSDYLEVLSNSASLLQNLISDVLDLSKIDAGAIELQEHPVDINHLVRYLVPTVNVKAQDKPLRFETDLDDRIGHTILTDKQLLSQILLNLLSNAEKFTEEGTVTTTVRVIEETEAHYQLFFSVQDTGIGMTETEVLQIFNQFTQANPEIRNSYGGTGLGLSISRRLVALLGGELRVEAQKGIGALFHFTLKVKKGCSLEQTQQAEAKEKKKNSPLSFIGRTALVVEDNEMNIKYLTSLLKKWGFIFETARNGQEALVMFEAQPFDIIFMDLQMPVMDGFTATRAIRKMGSRGAGIPIIALTASTFLSKKQLALKAGLSDFVSKPFTPTQLLEVAAQYLHPSGVVSTNTVSLSYSRELDHEYLQEIYAGDFDYAHEMFVTFLDIIEDELAALGANCTAKNLPEVKRLIHKIKPMFAMVGLTDLTARFADLESGLITKPESCPLPQIRDITDELHHKMPVLKQEASKLAQQVKS